MRPVLAMILCAVLLPACVPPPPDLPGRIERVGQRGPTPGSARGVTLLADAAPAAGGGLPVLVTVSNQGDRPLRLERTDFLLVPRVEMAADAGAAPAAAGAPLPPVAPANGRERAVALPEGVLGPGESARGYIYFPAGPIGPAELRLRLIDAGSGAVLDSIATGLPPRQHRRT